MKRPLFLFLLIFPSLVYAQRFGSIRSGDDVSLSSNTILNQNTLQSGATFYVSSGTVAGNISVGSATISGWSFYGINDDYMLIRPRSSGISLRINRTDGEINIGNASSASSVILKSQNSSGSGTISYTGPTNGYSSNSDIGLASGKSLRLYDSIDSNYVAIKASATVSQTNTYILPAVKGTSDQAITTNGSNSLRFQTVIVSTDELQSGTTFYVSSGTVRGNFNVYPSSAGRSNFLNYYTTFTDGFFDSKYLNQQAYIPSTDGSYGGLGYKIFASTTAGPQATTNVDPTLLFGFSSGANTATMGVGNSYIDVGNGTSDSATMTNGTDIIAMDESNGTYVAASSFTVYSNNSSGRLRIRDNDGVANYVVLRASNSLSSNLELVLPPSAGSANQAIITDGSNNLSFGKALAIPGGSDTMVQYNSGGSLAGHSGLLYYDSIFTLYGVNMLGVTQVGAYLGGTVVAYDNDGSNFVGLKSSASIATNNTYVLPASSGTANMVLYTDGSNNLAFGDPRRLLKFSEVFNAEQGKLPTSSPCVISNAGSLTIPAILCDASTDESVSWSSALIEYTTTTMRADIYYTMASATSGNVVHNISVMCASSTYTADLDIESFAPVNASTMSVPSVAGRIGIATMTLTNMDAGCVQGGLIIFKYTRDANAAADTASGDIEIRKIYVREP